MRWLVSRSEVGGEIEVPGDKSIGHRALMLAALAGGESHIDRLPDGQDVRSTATCLRALGTGIEVDRTATRVRATGELRQPLTPLDAGNSGTTARLLTGILAGQRFRACLTGDASLRRRPMDRVVDPLQRMGARITTTDGRAPLDITGTQLMGTTYTLPIPSAQVKSAVLLAGLFAEGDTVVREPVPSRDHTERMLRATGVSVDRQREMVRVRGGARPAPFHLRVPGDASSAAFFLAAAAITGGEVTVRNVGVNPTRAGFLRVLERMGARITVTPKRDEAGEPVGDVRCAGQELAPIEIDGPEIPLLVDEIPLVALLATQAGGMSRVRGAGELRHKETDRIATVGAALRALGADLDELPDGFTIRGPTSLRGARVESAGDHRLAMLLAVAGCVAAGETLIEGAAAAAVSYPRFASDFAALGARITDV